MFFFYSCDMNSLIILNTHEFLKNFLIGLKFLFANILNFEKTEDKSQIFGTFSYKPCILQLRSFRSI